MEKRGRARLLRLWQHLRSFMIFVVLFCVLIYFAQNRMIFHHVMNHNSRAVLQDIPEFHEVEFVAENGKTYHGVMRKNGNEVAPLVIYFGGNGEVSYTHMHGWELLNNWNHIAGYHYLFIDYDGYGLNSGRTNYRNMYETALAAYEYAINHPFVDSSRIVVMGFSLGTSSAVYLAANRCVAGLILLAPYANGYDLYNSVLPIFRGPMRLLVRQKFPSDQYAPNVSCPVLIIASAHDEIIPIASARNLGKLFPGEVDFKELQGVSHNGIFQAQGVMGRIQSFLEEK